MVEEEERFLTPEVLSAASMIGTRDELLEQLQQLADAGLDQVMILPNFDTRFDVLEQVGSEIIEIYNCGSLTAVLMQNRRPLQVRRRTGCGKLQCQGNRRKTCLLI